MNKPISMLNSFTSFIRLCRMYCNEEIPMSRLCIDEAQVFNELNKAKEKLHSALCDDFNTCEAVQILFELSSFINKKFQLTFDPNLLQVNEPITELDFNRHYGCVMSVCQFVESTLRLFGLNLENKIDQENVIIFIS